MSSDLDPFLRLIGPLLDRSKCTVVSLLARSQVLDPLRPLLQPGQLIIRSMEVLKFMVPFFTNGKIRSLIGTLIAGQITSASFSRYGTSSMNIGQARTA